MRQKVKSLIKKCFELHDSKKTLLLLIKFGAQNKNLKSAAEALDEIAIHLRQIQSVPLGEQHIKVIAKLVDSKDASVRENAIVVLSEIYKVVDEDIWRVMGQVPLKVKGLLETRFRKVKGMGASGSNLSNSLRGAGGPKKAVPASPRKAQPAAQQELTKSFNPGRKTQTPRTGGLQFKGTNDGSASGAGGG